MTNDQYEGEPMTNLAWKDFAICKGMTDLFYDCESSTTRSESGEARYGPSRATRDAVARAAAICDKCPVKVPCLEFALDNHERWGVWGGKAWYERRRILKRRGETARLHTEEAKRRMSDSHQLRTHGETVNLLKLDSGTQRAPTSLG